MCRSASEGRTETPVGAQEFLSHLNDTDIPQAHPEWLARLLDGYTIQIDGLDYSLSAEFSTVLNHIDTVPIITAKTT